MSLSKNISPAQEECQMDYTACTIYLYFLLLLWKAYTSPWTSSSLACGFYACENENRAPPLSKWLFWQHLPSCVFHWLGFRNVFSLLVVFLLIKNIAFDKGNGSRLFKNEKPQSFKNEISSLHIVYRKLYCVILAVPSEH